MVNATSKKTAMGTATLDKWWSKTVEEDKDIDMEDNHQKEPTDGNTEKTQTNKNKVTYKERFPTTLRFKIPSASVDEAHKKHMEILQSIAVYMGHCEIYSTNGDKTSIKQNNCDEFTYHEIKSRRQNVFVVIHRLVLDVKYHQIKKEQAVLKTLQRLKCQLHMHEWHHTEWDIINVGFISGSSPKHQSKDTLQHKLHLINKEQPKFNLHATPLKMETEGREFRTLAYEVQCPRKNYNEVCEYIAKTCKVLDQTFIKYQWKHSNRTTFDNGIKKQILFVDSIRTIPIYGIHPIAMEKLYDELIADHDIIEINSTSKTADYGRWNIHVTADNFEAQTKWFQTNIERIYQDKCSIVRNEIPSDYTPEVRFNYTITFQQRQPDTLIEDAEQSVSSYTNTSIGSRSWASVVSEAKTKSQPTISTITSSNNFTDQITKLNQTIQTICSRLDKLEERMNKQADIIQKLQGIENTFLSQFERLSDMIEKLEERNANVNPRRLELSFMQNESNKRQNTNSTPTKDRNRA